jgi:hypothetical protein
LRSRIRHDSRLPVAVETEGIRLAQEIRVGYIEVMPTLHPARDFSRPTM